MSNLKNPSTKGSDLSRDGKTISSFGYTLEKTILTTHSGEKIEISNLVNNILIDETLYTPYSKVTFQIVDATALLETLDIRGDEEIECVLKRTGDFEGKFNLKLKIAEITAYVKKDIGKQFYKLVCIQEHMYENQKVILSRSFQGSPSSLIRKICSNDLKMPFEKTTNITARSKGQIKGIYPLVRPISAINWLARNSFDDGTPIFFYHTVKAGLNLKSYKDLLEVKYKKTGEITSDLSGDTTKVTFENDHIREYKASFGQITGAVKENSFFIEESKRVLKITGMNSSQYVAIGSGAYSSTVVSLDISTKRLSVDKFNYNELNTKLEKEKPFVNLENSESEKSKTYYINTNSQAFRDSSFVGPGYTNYHGPTQGKSVAQYEAYKKNLNMNTFKIDVSGDFNMQPGAIIKLKVISGNANSSEQINKYLTSKYLVKEVQHSFDDRYTMKLTICRDSFHRSNNNDNT